MRVNEIVREENLNEIAPFAAAGGLAAIFSAVMLGLKAYTVYDMYDVLSKNGYDIDNMSSDDKFSLFLNFVTLLVPGGGPTMNNMIMKFMPAWAKKRAIKMVSDKLAPMAKDLRNMKNANRAKYRNTANTPPKQAAKNTRELTKANKKLDAQYKAAGNQLAVEKLKGPAFTIIGGIALLPLTYTYYGKIDDLEKQYSAYKTGDKSTSLFNTMDSNSAYTEYKALRNKYIGELSLGVAAALSKTPVIKLVQTFNGLVGKAVSFGVGRIAGGLVQLPLGIATRLATVGGPALTIMMQTDIGKKFLENSIVEMITKGVGVISDNTLNLLTKAIDSALSSAGISSNINQKVSAQTPPAANQSGSSPAGKAAIAGLDITSSQSNPKIKLIGRDVVTDQNGYLLNNIPTRVRIITDKAKGLGLPNPLDQIPKNPNIQYSY